MMRFKLISHFAGNTFMWLYYGGKKSIDEVAEKDNSTVGFIAVMVTLLLIFGFQ